MDLKQLELLDRIIECGSFSAAATALHLTQPTLSRRIALLEAELGQRLLERTGRGVAPTEAGCILQRHARTLLDVSRRARDELADLASSPSGRVVVGLPPRLAQVVSTELIRRFRRRFPRAVISVTEALSLPLRESLVAGRVDLALLFDPAASPQLVYETLAREKLVLVGPGRARALPERVPLAALADYPMVLPSVPNAIRNLLEATLGPRGIRLDVVAEVNAVQTVLALVQDGVGYTVLPEGALTLAVGPGNGPGDDPGSDPGGGPARGPAGSPALSVAEIGPPAIRNRLVLAEARARPATRLLRETAALLRSLDYALHAGRRRAPARDRGAASKAVASRAATTKAAAIGLVAGLLGLSAAPPAGAADAPTKAAASRAATAPAATAPAATAAAAASAPAPPRAAAIARGRAIALGRQANCMLCHRIPGATRDEPPFGGDLGPPLAGVATRHDATALRARLASPERFNPDTIMPSYTRVDGLRQVPADLRGRPILEPGQLEDVLQWLLSLD